MAAQMCTNLNLLFWFHGYNRNGKFSLYYHQRKSAIFRYDSVHTVKYH
jgi:hypothetical protein